MESVSIRRIQCVGYGVLEFLGTVYCSCFLRSLLVSAGTDMPYLLDGYSDCGEVARTVSDSNKDAVRVFLGGCDDEMVMMVRSDDGVGACRWGNAGGGVSYDVAAISRGGEDMMAVVDLWCGDGGDGRDGTAGLVVMRMMRWSGGCWPEMAENGTENEEEEKWRLELCLHKEYVLPSRHERSPHGSPPTNPLCFKIPKSVITVTTSGVNSVSQQRRRWLELLKDYDTNIQYHLGKANVVADALSRKSGMLANLQIEPEIIKYLECMDIELCIRGTKGYWASLKIEPNLILRIKEAQKEDAELWAMFQKSEEDEQTKFRVDDDGVMWFGDRLCVPSDPLFKRLCCQKLTVLLSLFIRVKIEHQRASEILQPLDIPVWKLDGISMDFVTGLPRT
nr:hypothetical protein [Tanacetum cinerariifolium]